MNEKQLSSPDKNMFHHRMSLNTDLLFFKNDMLGDLKQQENKLSKKIDRQIDDTQKKLFQFQTKLDSLANKFFSIANTISENIQLKEKVDSLLKFRTKIEETTLNQDLKLNSISKELVSAINKYDKLIENNILYQGIIGASNARFPTFHNFIDYVLKNISELVIFRDKTMDIDFKGYKTKMESLVEGFKKQASEIIVGCNSFTSQSIENLEKKIKSDLDLYNQRLFNLKIQNTEQCNELEKMSNNLLNEFNKFIEMKKKIENDFEMNIKIINNHFNSNEKNINECQNDYHELKKKYDYLLELLKEMQNMAFQEFKEKGNINETNKKTKVESYLKRYIGGEVGMDQITHLRRTYSKRNFSDEEPNNNSINNSINKKGNNYPQSQKNIKMKFKNENGNNNMNFETNFNINNNYPYFNSQGKNIHNFLNKSLRLNHNLLNLDSKLYSNNTDDKKILNNQGKEISPFNIYRTSSDNLNKNIENMNEIKEELRRSQSNDSILKNDLFNFNKNININEENKLLNFNIQNNPNNNLNDNNEKEKYNNQNLYDNNAIKKNMENINDNIILENIEYNSSNISEKNENNINKNEIKNEYNIYNNNDKSNINDYIYNNDYNMIIKNNENNENNIIDNLITFQNKENNTIFKNYEMYSNNNNKMTNNIYNHLIPTNKTFEDNPNLKNNFHIEIKDKDINDNQIYNYQEDNNIFNNETKPLYINDENKKGIHKLLKGEKNALSSFKIVKDGKEGKEIKIPSILYSYTTQSNNLNKIGITNNKTPFRSTSCLNFYSYRNPVNKSNYEFFKDIIEEDNNMNNKIINNKIRNLSNRDDSPKKIKEKLKIVNLPGINENKKNKNNYDDDIYYITKLRKIKYDNDLYRKNYGPFLNNNNENKKNNSRTINYRFDKGDRRTSYNRFLNKKDWKTFD